MSRLAGGVARLGIALGIWAAYRGSLHGPFVYDDLGTIVGNASIRRFWPPAAWLHPPGASTAAGRPVLNGSLAINYALGGLNVAGYHAANLAIHALCALVLFGIVRRTLRRTSPARPALRSVVLAFLIALIWAVHPLQTEAVTYVVQRAESLMGLFYLLTLYGLVRATDPTSSDGLGSGSVPTLSGSVRGRARNARSVPLREHSIRLDRPRSSSVWLGFSGLACLLGMATKEVMVTAPVLVLLYDRTFVAISFREIWQKRRAYYLGLGSTWILLGLLVASAGTRGRSAGFGGGISVIAYWATQAPAILHYLRLAFWPHPLIFNYGYERYWGTHSTVALAADALLVGAGLAAVWVIGRSGGPAQIAGGVEGQLPRFKHAGALAFLVGWVLAILAPTSVVPVFRQTLAEHRMYLPLAAVVVAAVCGIDALLGRLTRPKAVGAGLGWRDAGLLAIGGIIAAGCCLLTARRNQVYVSELRLWQDTVAQAPGNAWARNNFGVYLARAGQTGEAIAQYREALRINPADAEAENNLGNALIKSQRAAEAVAHFETAIRLDPHYADACDGLGIALDQQGRPEEAIVQFEAALRIRPDYAEVHNNLGLALGHVKRGAEAIAHYQAALRLKPDYAEAHNNLGVALSRLGRDAEAAAEFEAALRLNPGYAAARANLEVLRKRARSP